MSKEITLDYYIKYGSQIIQKLSGMVQRCENPKSFDYKYYGAKGIKVCSEWKDDPDAFIYWCWENKYFLGCHIHRLNTHKDYTPENCILCSPEEHYESHSEIAKSKREAAYEAEMEALAAIIGERNI